MRCPKCHYLSFDPEPRCRNCGYDLEVADDELALKTAEPADGTLPDLTLRERPSAPVTPLPLEIARVAPDLTEHDEAPRLTRAPHTTAEMPLFVKGMADHEEFSDEEQRGARPAPSLPPARPPLAVRRAAPTPAPAPLTAPPVGPAIVRAAAASRRLGPLDRDLLEDLKRVEREETMRGRVEARPAGLPVEPLAESSESVEPLRRAGAAAVDAAVLGGMAAFVFWATLKVCAINLSDLETAALIPLVLFIVAMDVTYLLMFTAAGGQTIGKMLTGIRVVDDDAADGAPVLMRQAAWRAGLTVVALGLGWLPALFGRGVALHDWLTHTRVVRA